MQFIASRLSIRFLLLVALGLTAVASYETQNVSEAFLKWTKEHNKIYDTKKETLKREKTFAKNLAKIEEHNADKTNTYEMGLNVFSDMEFEEFRNLYLMAPQNCSATTNGRKLAADRTKLPLSFDWRTKGVVTPVKNQGNCGSCWTFSTTGAMESHHAIATGNLISLSEQQLVDCAHNFDNYGCEGGLPSHAFEYIYYNAGIELETTYPYIGKDRTCLFNRSEVAAMDKGSFNITMGDEDEILSSVVLKGPVSIAYDCQEDFMHYKKGVYQSKNCPDGTQSVNHAVLVVGFGQTDDGLEYWIVKNSWSVSFGMDGYFWIKRGVNMCGLAECASYPIV